MDIQTADMDTYKENKLPHEVSEVICTRCGFRWIVVRPQGMYLKGMECRNCGIGFVIINK